MPGWRRGKEVSRAHTILGERSESVIADDGFELFDGEELFNSDEREGFLNMDEELFNSDDRSLLEVALDEDPEEAVEEVVRFLRVRR